MARKKIRTDYGLKLLREALGLDALHFGYWKKNRELTLENARRAQDDYTEKLLSFIPDGVRSVLDSGCGVGHTSETLLARGYEVTGISPDPYQQQQYTARFGSRAAFHLTKVEDFAPGKTFDLVLMSESAQYVSKSRFFGAVTRLTKPGGYLLVADCFRTRRRSEKYYRGCFVESSFLARAERAGFRVLKSENITEQTTPSLELATTWYRQYMKPALEAAAGVTRQEAPVLTKVAKLLCARHISRLHNYFYERLPTYFDADRFRKEMKYMIFLLAR